MKKTILLLCSLAVLCFSSCMKEDTNGKSSNANLVKVCFHATNDLADSAPETKIGLNDNATKYVWKEGDKVGIYDTGTTSFKEFSVSKVYPDGSADIEGFMTESNTAPYYAIYPYNADAAITTWADANKVDHEVIVTALKRDQTATAGSIPPESIFVAKSDDENLVFKSVTGYVSFTVKSDNIKSVTLEDNAKTTLVANKLNVYTDGSGNGGPSDGAYFASLLGDFQNGQTYYIAVRAGGFNSGLTISFKDSDGNVYYRTSSNTPASGAGANRLLKLGDLSTDKMALLNDNNDRLLKWIHGVDFTFGNTTINKYTHPHIIRYNNTIKDGLVCFIDTDISVTSSSNAIIMSRYEDKRIKLTREVTNGNPLFIPATEGDDCSVLSNVELNVVTSTAYLMTNNKDYPLERLILDRIKINVPANKHLIQVGSAKRPIKNVTIVNSDIIIGVNTSAAALFNVGQAVTEPVEHFVFENNVLSSPATTTNATKGFNIFKTAANVTTGNIVFNSNTVVNVYPQDFYVVPQVFSVNNKNEIKNNLFYFDYEIYKKVYSTTLLISNIGVGNELFTTLNSSASQNYTIYDKVTATDAVTNGIPNARLKLALNIDDTAFTDGIVNKTSETQNVFDLDDTAKFNIAEGIFVNKSTVYGAQR